MGENVTMREMDRGNWRKNWSKPRPIICLTDGKLYLTQQDAATALGVSAQTIRRNVRAGKEVNGFRMRFAEDVKEFYGNIA